MLICPKCSNYNPDDATACLRCGTPFPRQVPAASVDRRESNIDRRSSVPDRRAGNAVRRDQATFSTREPGNEPVSDAARPSGTKAEIPGWVSGGVLASIGIGVAGLLISGMLDLSIAGYFIAAAVVGFIGFGAAYLFFRWGDLFKK